MIIPHTNRLRRLLASGLFLTFVHLTSALPVFPGAVGFGTDTPAPPGRGGTVYKVTTLADAHPTPPAGSLRWACNQTGPRVIVFEVSGVIDLVYYLTVNEPNCTIAGQTAPAPGITLKNFGLLVQASNVLVQHIASRPGKELIGDGTRDTQCFFVQTRPGIPVSDVVFDHVSATWNTDEQAGTWGQNDWIRDVTYSNSILAHGLAFEDPDSAHEGFGPLAGIRTARVSFIRNIMAFQQARNPLIRDDIESCQVVENFIYHPGPNSFSGIYVGSKGAGNLDLAVSAIGNVLLRAPSAPAIGFYVRDDCATNLSLYLNNNRLFSPDTGLWYPTDGNPYGAQIYHQGVQTHVLLGSDPHTASGVVPWGLGVTAGDDTSALELVLLPRVGKHPAPGFRDAIDTRTVSKITARTGITSTTWAETVTEYPFGPNGDDPWYPARTQNTRALAIPASPNDIMPSGYTRLEEWLHGWSAIVEGTAGSEPVLAGHWTLDATSGTSAADSSGNGNTGTLSNGPVWTASLINGGLSFDGADDAVNAGSGASLDNLPAMTVAAWIKPSSMGEVGKGRIVDKSTGTTPTNGWSFHVDGTNQLAFRMDYSSGQLNRVSAIDVISTGDWKHVAATWDGTASSSGVHLYVDGEEVSYASWADGAGTRDLDAAANLSVGNDSTGARTFHGVLDDVRVYNGALSASDVLALYQSALPAPSGLSAAPIAYNQIDLSWADNSSNETGFNVERKKGTGGSYAEIGTTAANVTSYNDATAGAGTQYHYRVRSFNTGGNSSYSNEANATTVEITSGRQGHWKLDASTGTTATDCSGNSNTGTLSGGPVWGAGKIANGLSFDGIDDSVNAGSGASLDQLAAITVAAWIKASSMGENGKGRIVDKSTGTSPANGWAFHVDGTNQLAFRVDYSTTQLNRVSAADVVSSAGTVWNHVVATWDGTTSSSGIHVYVNDIEVSYTGGSYSDGVGDRDPDGAAHLFLGTESTGTRTFHGALDDVRVYNRVLSASEITAIHRAGL